MGIKKPNYSQKVSIEKPTVEQTAQPTAEPAAESTAEPTTEPTAEPAAEPAAESTAEPTVESTAEPTEGDTVESTAEPTEGDTTEPTKDGDTAEPPQGNAAEPTAEPMKEKASVNENNKSIVKKKLLGNIKKSQFVGTNINSIKRGIFGLFQTMLKDAEKGKKVEGKVEGKAEGKAEGKNIFGSIGNLNNLNPKDMFDTFVFNGNNYINGFLFDKNDETYIDDHDKTTFEDFSIGIKDKNIDLNKKYNLFYDTNNDKLSFTIDDNGFNLTLEPGEEKIYKIKVGDFLHDLKTEDTEDKKTEDTEDKKTEDTVFNQEDIDDRIEKINERVDNETDIQKKNKKIIENENKLEDLQYNSKITEENLEKKENEINDKYNPKITELNDKINKNDTEIKNLMTALNTANPEEKKVLEKKLLLENEKRNKLSEEKEILQENRKKEMSPVFEEKDENFKLSHEARNELSNENDNLKTEIDKKKSMMESIDKLDDVTDNIEKKGETRMKEEMNKETKKEEEEKLDKLNEKTMKKVDKKLEEIRDEIDKDFKTALEKNENKEVKKCFFKKNENYIEFITQEPIIKDDLLEIRNITDEDNKTNEKKFYLKYNGDKEVGKNESFKLYDENEEITTFKNLEDVADNYRLIKKESIVEKKAKEIKEIEEEKNELKKNNIKTETIMKSNAFDKIKIKGFVNGEIVEGTDNYKLVAESNNIVWGDNVKIIFNDKTPAKVIKLEKNMTMKGGAIENEESSSEGIENVVEFNNGDVIIENITLNGINSLTKKIIEENVEQEKIKSMFNNWETGLKKAYIKKDKKKNKKKFYLESDESLSKGEYFQAIGENIDADYFKTPRIFQFIKFE